MKKWMVWVGIGVVLCFVVEGLFAEEGEKPKREEAPKALKVSGKIKSVSADEGKLVVLVRTKTEEGVKEVEKSFKVNADTKVLKGEAQIALGDLAEGNMVVVTYKEAGEGGGDPIATQIQVWVPKPKTE